MTSASLRLLIICLLVAVHPTVGQTAQSGAATAAVDTATDTVLVRAARMLDVVAGAYIDDVVIEIVEGRIVRVTSGADPSAPATVDLGERTILPGLIDVHTHLADRSWLPEEQFDHWSMLPASFGIAGVMGARETLHAGFTTVRNVSEPYFAGLAVRDAIAAQSIEGPRVFASGPMLTITGGHGAWGNWMAPTHQVSTSAHAIADSEDDVRRTVREHLRVGVDLIKIAATGGFGTPRSIPGAASYTEGALRAAVDEARKRGAHVAAHAHGEEGILNAVRAGVHSIEHASLIGDEGITVAKESGTWLVMDLLAAHYDLVERDRDYDDKALEGDNAAVYRDIEQRFRRAYEAGVRLAFGTDAGVFPHGRNAEQFALMVAAGMRPADAIRSATIWAAELLGIEQDTGHLRVGARADLIAVTGDPLHDPSVLTQVQFVMQQGRVVRRP